MLDAVGKSDLPASAEWGQIDSGGDDYGRSVGRFISIADAAMAKKLMEAMAQGQEAYLWFTRAADDPWAIFGAPCAVRVSRNVYGCEATAPTSSETPAPSLPNVHTYTKHVGPPPPLVPLVPLPQGR
eukprot:SAG11_NODE_10284_length_842_cov_0.830417_2_plen_126_part_01